MTRRLVAPSLVLAVTLLPTLHGSAAAQSQPELGAYGVLGIASVHLASGARVQPGAVGATAGSVRLAARAAAPGSVVAAAVQVGRRADVGRLFCRIVSGPGFRPGVVGGGPSVPGCRSLTEPVVDPALIAPVVVVPGATDLIVPPRSGTEPVAAGAFGAVTVGRGGLLQLAGGDYQLRSIRLARRARLVCLADCRIAVAESVRLGIRAQFGAGAGAVRTDRVRVDVAGNDGVYAFRTGRAAVVAATVVAPAGEVRLGPAGDYRGAFIGQTVVLKPRSRVREDSALVPPRR